MANEIEEWIESWLFRGRPPSGPGSDQRPYFQVEIGRQIPSALRPSGYERDTVGPLSPEAAEAAGWPLSRLVEGVNTTAIARSNELQAELEAMQRVVAEKDAALASAAADGERLIKAIAGLQARIDAMTAEAAANLQAWQTAIAEKDAALQAAAETEQSLRAELEAAKAAMEVISAGASGSA